MKNVLFKLTLEQSAAKLVVMATENQASEIGDGTTQIFAIFC
jgi:chaperonin GroEL (HSP60 family)